MHRRRFLASVGIAGVAGVAGCNDDGGTPPATDDTTAVTDGATPGDGTSRDAGPTATRSTETADGGEWTFRVGDDGFERARAGSDGPYEPLTVRGVNLGMAKPGYFPGEAAISRAEYDRWIAAMGELGNVVRTYTIHPPAFYRALAAYNDGADDPLHLLQGTWVPTPDLLEAGDATAISETVDRELRRTVDAVHGATTLPDRPGHASGTYDADVSGATLGYLFGIEWPPEVVAATNEAAAGGEYEGRHFRTEDGSGFERWLAERLDVLAGRERDEYGSERPAGFVNWVTTDPLDHPYEPFPDEDRVSVDPDAVVATDAADAGTFAAYHVYPYYPDLLNETPEYVDYVDHRGEPNSYAGYLNDLVGATDHPLVVAEFGVPSSRGIAHRDVHGRDQGHHTERRQGEHLAAMSEDILREGAAGAVAFAWHDEWFKRTWNLDARSDPNRRPFWSNVETPEQRFGLLAFESPDAVTLSGTAAEWADATVVDPGSSVGNASVGSTSAGPDSIEALRVTHDLEGLALRVEFADLSDPVEWSAGTVLLTVGLTGRRTELPFGTDATVNADFAVRLAGPDDSRLLVDSRYDAFAREFGWLTDLDLGAYRDGSAGFVPVREPINRGYTVPPTGERVPFEAVETGQLRYGNGDPDHADYDSLTDVHVDSAGDAVELKLPWVLLNVADPSSKRRIATDWDDGLATVPFDGVSVAAATYEPGADGSARDREGATNLAAAAPGLDGERLRAATYAWEPWDRPAYEERLKPSYGILRRAWDEG